MGMKPIRWDGREKVKLGVTTIEEVLRVTMEDEFAVEDEAQAQIAQAVSAAVNPDALSQGRDD